MWINAPPHPKGPNLALYKVSVPLLELLELAQVACVDLGRGCMGEGRHNVPKLHGTTLENIFGSIDSFITKHYSFVELGGAII